MFRQNPATFWIVITEEAIATKKHTNPLNELGFDPLAATHET
jgi:hypothetical protein